MSCKADDTGELTPVREENDAGRKIYRKDGAVFRLVDYKVYFILCR